MDITSINSHHLHGLVMGRAYKVNLVKECSYFIRAEGCSKGCTGVLQFLEEHIAVELFLFFSSLFSLPLLF